MTKKIGTAGIVFSVVEMTPEQAAKLLERNECNRRPKLPHVDELAWQIIHDAWQVNPQPVCVDINGRLIDGQHRLMAIIKAGKAATVTLAENVPAKSAEVIDYSTVPRSNGDVFVMHGVKHGVRAAAALRAMAGAEMNGASVRISRAQLWSMYEQNRESLSWALDVTGTHEGRKMACLFVAAIAYAHPVAKDDVERFADYVLTGANIPEGSPALLFIRLLAASSWGGGDHRAVMFKKALRAIHAYVTGEKLGKLQQSEEGMKHFYAARQKLGLSPIYKETP